MDKLREALANDVANATYIVLHTADGSKGLGNAEHAALVAALAQPQNDAEAVETSVALAINDELCRQIDAMEEKDTWNVTSKVLALPIMQNLLRGLAPPSPELERMRKALKCIESAARNDFLTVNERFAAIRLFVGEALSREGDNHASDCKVCRCFDDRSRELCLDKDKCRPMAKAFASDGKESEGDEATFGCKRAGGFVDRNCMAPCDCHVTQRLSHPSDPTPAQERREEIAQALLDRFIERCSVRIQGSPFPRGTKINTLVHSYRDDFLADADAILALPPAPKGEPSQEWEKRDLAAIVKKLTEWREDDHEDAIVVCRSHVCRILDALRRALSAAKEER